MQALVEKASRLGQPALAITDHGSMAGAVQLYKGCRALGLLPFPGSELYVVAELEKEETRHHLTAFARTTRGYQGLVRLSSLSHQRDHYHYKPRVSWSDLAEWGADYGDDVVVTTGCFFGPIQQALAEGDRAKAKRLTAMLAGWLPRLHVELQHHHTDHEGITDDWLVSELYSIATELGLPVLVTMDCHYLDHSDTELHQAMKAIAYSSEPGDVAFPGDTYHLSSADWVQAHLLDHPGVWEASCEAMGVLLDDHQLSIPTLDEYRFYVPQVTGDPDGELRALCELELLRRGLGDEYWARLETELDVISATGFSDYHLLVHDYVRWAVAHDILVRARGSAGGSLVCWLLGFTETDPIRWDLSFERYLTVDRERPPDIDLDVEDTRRDEVIEYLIDRWDAVQIGTWAKVGLDPDNPMGGGSLFVQYLSSTRKRMEAAAETKAAGARLYKETYGAIKSMGDLERTYPDDAKVLRALDDRSMRRSWGAHAAGFVVQHPDLPLADWVPTMLVASSDTQVTQYEMDDVEDLGYIKVDVLGLRSLSTLHEACNLLGVDWQRWSQGISLADPEVYAFLRKGLAETGIFQMEGYTAAKGLREMKVRTFEDLVLVNALYRPATRNAGLTDLFVRRRQGLEWTLPHPILEPVLGPTLGVPVFQEQALEIARLVGLDATVRNRLLKAAKVKHGQAGMSAASSAAFEQTRDAFLSAAIDSGMTDEAATETWSMIEGFAAYGFNKCATGDTVLYMIDPDTELHRAGANQHTGTAITVQELFDIWHGPKTPTRDKYRDPNRGLRVAAHTDGRILIDQVVDVWYVGDEPTWTVTTAGGRSITTTANHRHLSEHGWRQVSELAVGECLATMGEYEHYYTPTGGQSHIKNGRKDAYAKLPAYCEQCGAHGRGVRLEVAHLDHNRQHNTRENLRRLCSSCHKLHDFAPDGPRRRRWTKGRPVVWDPIVSIEPAGTRPVYDIEMKGDDHSWVGNGIVTHNSHAVSYSLLGYQLAYLKVHYPVEFHTALLATTAGTPKEKQYEKAARAMGVRIVPPDVNRSGVIWEMDGAVIRRGLTSIKGVGQKAAAHLVEHRPYTDMDDLLSRVNARVVTGGKSWHTDRTLNGVLGHLRDAGALRSLGVSR